MGWNPRDSGRPGIPDPQHARRHPRRRRHAHRARLSHRPLGGRPADGGRGEGVEVARRRALRRLLHRSLRRPHARHHRHVRQPALSQRCRHRLPPPDPLAAHAPRRDRRRHLRQRPARHDDGARRACTTCRASWCPAASRCWPKKAKTRARCKRSARASRTARSRSKTPRNLLPRLRHARRRLPVPRHRGHLAGRRRSARHVAARIPRSRPPAIPSGSTWPAAPRAPRCRSKRAASRMRDILTDAAHPTTPWSLHAAFGGSTNLILHLPAIAHAAGLRASHRRRLDAHQPPGAAPGRRAAQRPALASHRAGLPGRRRARSHAAPAPRRPARLDALTVTGERSAHMLDWWEQSERRAQLAPASAASATASIPTT